MITCVAWMFYGSAKPELDPSVVGPKIDRHENYVLAKLERKNIFYEPSSEWQGLLER